MLVQKYRIILIYPSVPCIYLKIIKGSHLAAVVRVVHSSVVSTLLRSDARATTFFSFVFSLNASPQVEQYVVG